MNDKESKEMARTGHSGQHIRMIDNTAKAMARAKKRAKKQAAPVFKVR